MSERMKVTRNQSLWGTEANLKSPPRCLFFPRPKFSWHCILVLAQDATKGRKRQTPKEMQFKARQKQDKKREERERAGEWASSTAANFLYWMPSNFFSLLGRTNVGQLNDREALFRASFCTRPTWEKAKQMTFSFFPSFFWYLMIERLLFSIGGPLIVLRLAMTQRSATKMSVKNSKSKVFGKMKVVHAWK